MPKVAKAEPGTVIQIGAGPAYHFGDDGTRQVSEAEAEQLRRYVEDGGTKVEIAETKMKGRG